MVKAIEKMMDWMGRPHRVEFDYRDSIGQHHGSCYVRYLFGGEEQVKRMLSSYGYTNIHIL